jgi:hypothetical protein
MAIQWAPTVKAVLITHRLDMDDVEITATWYSQQDYKSFKEDCQTCAKLARSGHLTGPTYEALYCTRGLECMISTQRINLKISRRQCARQAVLGEQDDQHNIMFEDADIIAEEYRDISRPCQCEAHRMGLRDQQTVAAHSESETCCVHTYTCINNKTIRTTKACSSLMFHVTENAVRT